MTALPAWTATIIVERDPPVLDRLARTLAPEASREVPRARCELLRPNPNRLELHVEAQDTGALRAAVNTYLGWISLTDRTEAVGRSVG